MTAKYGWIEGITNLMDWNILGLTIYRLPNIMWKTIEQYNHGWLPTLDHSGTKTIHRLPRFPRFMRELETNNHFLACSIIQDAIVNILISELEQRNKATPKILLELIVYGILEQTTPPLNYKNQELTELFDEQKSIGWKILLHRKWTTQWRLQYNRLNNTNNGKQWAIQKY
jgi:hypothetical protein